MRSCGFEWALGGVALLLVSCGGGSGQTDGGGRGGSGAAGGASGHAGGTGGGSASCPTVSPCGGNIVGTWKVTQTCITETADLSKECTGGAGTSASANITLMFSGTVTYNADGTYTSALTGTDMGQEHYSERVRPPRAHVRSDRSGGDRRGFGQLLDRHRRNVQLRRRGSADLHQQHTRNLLDLGQHADHHARQHAVRGLLLRARQRPLHNPRVRGRRRNFHGRLRLDQTVASPPAAPRKPRAFPPE